MTLEIGICQEPVSIFNGNKKYSNESCIRWKKYEDRREISHIKSSTMICSTCNFWKKTSNLRQSNLPPLYPEIC